MSPRFPVAAGFATTATTTTSSSWAAWLSTSGTSDQTESINEDNESTKIQNGNDNNDLASTTPTSTLASTIQELKEQQRTEQSSSSSSSDSSGSGDETGEFHEGDLGEGIDDNFAVTGAAEEGSADDKPNIVEEEDEDEKEGYYDIEPLPFATFSTREQRNKHLRHRTDLPDNYSTEQKPKASLFLDLPPTRPRNRPRPLPSNPVRDVIWSTKQQRKLRPLPSSPLSNSTIEYKSKRSPRASSRLANSTIEYVSTRRRQPRVEPVTNQRTTDKKAAILQPNIPIPTSNWIMIENIPPLSSLEAMLKGVDDALEAEWVEQGSIGFADLDSPSDGDDSSTRRVFVDFPAVGAARNSGGNENGEPNVSSRWVSKAHLRLSHLGRPNGWHMQLANRSVVYALLQQAKKNRLFCSWKPVNVEEYHPPSSYLPFPSSSPSSLSQNSEDSGNQHDHPESFAHATTDLAWRAPVVTDATVRVEQVPEDYRMIDVYNLFTRFDLASPRQLRERGIVPPPPPPSNSNNDNDGVDAQGNSNNSLYYKDPIFLWDPPAASLPPRLRVAPTTYLVHFASAAWARAAVRDKQGARIYNGYNVLKLAQYPKQLL